MAAEPYLVITDGTDTCTFSDGAGGATNYIVASNSWAPVISRLRRSALGGHGPYEDVVEEWDIHVTGASVPAALANLAVLARLLEKAERWARGENLSPVLVKFSPRGATVSSTSNPLQAIILGPAAGDQVSGLRLPVTFDNVGWSGYVIRARLRFVRRGAWLLATTVDGTSAGAANPAVMSLTSLASHNNLSPCKVKIAGFQFGTVFDFADSLPIVLLARQASDLQLVEAEGGTGTAYTSVADSGNNASGGSVLRYTPTGTSEAASGEISLPSVTAGARLFAFFAAIRNNSASVTFQVRVGGLVQVRASPAANSIAAYTRPVLIDTAHTRPRFVPLGVLATPADLKSCKLLFTAASTSGSPTIDVDYLICLAIDQSQSRAIQLDKLEATGAYAHVAAIDVIVDPRPLTVLAPRVYRAFQGTSDEDPLGYYGDAFPIAGPTGLAAAIMCKETNTNWRSMNSGSPTSLALTVYRYNAYLSPE